jgi:hypothetical protein
MGLTFENPPAPFAYRVVVPVAIASRVAPSCAWLAHLPNNYANDPSHHLGKVAMTDLFASNFNAEKEVALPAFNSTGQKWFRFHHRLGNHFRMLGRGLLIGTMDSLRRVKRMILGPRKPGQA